MSCVVYSGGDLINIPPQNVENFVIGNPITATKVQGKFDLAIKDTFYPDQKLLKGIPS